MIFGGGLLGLALLALWVYCILDVIAADESLVRNMPKLLWLIVVIIVPTVGAVAWLALGRPLKVGLRPGDASYRRARPPIGPEDSPHFISRLDERDRQLRKWEEDLQRREEELRRRDRGDEAGDDA